MAGTAHWCRIHAVQDATPCMQETHTHAHTRARARARTHTHTHTHAHTHTGLPGPVSQSIRKVEREISIKADFLEIDRK